MIFITLFLILGDSETEPSEELEETSNLNCSNIGSVNEEFELSLYSSSIPSLSSFIFCNLRVLTIFLPKFFNLLLPVGFASTFCYSF